MYVEEQSVLNGAIFPLPREVGWGLFKHKYFLNCL